MLVYSKREVLDFLNDERSGVLYFFTPMCGTCQLAGRMLEVVEQLFQEVPFYKADLNYMPEVAEQFEIESVPCMLVIKEGIVFEKIYAFQSVPYLHSVISRHFQ